MSRLIFVLKASRPGLWFPTLWLYLMPLNDSTNWTQPAFWLGLLYVAFPLNLLVYGWNDLVDIETDRINPRKGTWLFGAKGSDVELAALPKTIFWVQLLFWPPLIWFGGVWMLTTLCGVVLFCWLYNHPERGWRKQPPLDLLCQIGYLLTLPVATLLNSAPFPSVAVMGYLCLFCLQSQLLGEVMDVKPDRASGRKTTATELTIGPTKILIMAIVCCEICLTGVVFKDWIFAGGLGLFLIWLLYDFFINKTRDYTAAEFTLFGIGSNAAAISSMAYVWWSGIFVQA